MSLLFVVATLTLLISISIVSSCGLAGEIVYLGGDVIIQKLENGNWEVTEELVILYRKYKKFWEEHHDHNIL